MDAWVDEWRRLIAPLREKQGFKVVNAWTIEENNQFVWILRFDGADWKAADAAYYASPERTAMTPDPARHIEKAEQSFLRALPEPAPRAKGEERIS
jgi:hypothetical protein